MILFWIHPKINHRFHCSNKVIYDYIQEWKLLFSPYTQGFRVYWSCLKKKYVRVLRTMENNITFVMEVKLFKWANVLKRCERDVKMRIAFENFKEQLHYCNWKIPSDITKSFRTADIVPCSKKSYNRVVFNVGGNKYRLICGYTFGKQKVVLYIRFLGTHKEYDKVKVCEVNMF